MFLPTALCLGDIVGADACTRLTWTVTNGTVSRIKVAKRGNRSEKQYKAPEEGKRDQLLRHDRNCSGIASLRADT